MSAPVGRGSPRRAVQAIAKADAVTGERVWFAAPRWAYAKAQERRPTRLLLVAVSFPSDDARASSAGDNPRMTLDEKGARAITARDAALILGAVAVTAGLGARATTPALSSRWYRRLDKPSWQPPGPVFGPVWTVVYALIAASMLVTRRNGGDDAQRPLFVLFGTNLALNLAWTLIFFRGRSPLAAGVEILMLEGTTVALVVRAWPASRLASLLLVPYAMWLLFATALTWTIWAAQLTPRRSLSSGMSTCTTRVGGRRFSSEGNGAATPAPAQCGLPTFSCVPTSVRRMRNTRSAPSARPVAISDIDGIPCRRRAARRRSRPITLARTQPRFR